jgi:TrmH family RNA methyltransferase
MARYTPRVSALPRIVLVHPRNADNLLSIAGAMKQFGLKDWVAVSTLEHLEGMRSVLKNHRAPGKFTDEVMRLGRVETLAEAIADCSWAVATTMRELEGRPRFTPRELAEETTRRRDTTWALVFGAEVNGLQNAEVEQCHAVSFIPSSEEQPSLNLSQAVVVYAHELASVPHDVSPGEVLATDKELRALRAVIETRLSNKREIDGLMHSLSRASLTSREAEAWRSAWTYRG